VYLHVVVDAFDATHFGAVGAAVDFAFGFDSVTDHVAIAMGAFGRQSVDRTFETVERMMFATSDNFESSVVFVSANFAA
jgi:hypothetical protein